MLKLMAPVKFSFLVIFGLLDKTLKDLGLEDGSILTCDDFLQNYKIQIVLYQTSELAEGVEFEIVGDLSKLEAKPESEAENGNGKHGK